MSKILQYLSIGFVGIYIIYIYLIKRLTYLIAERYVWLTVLAGFVMIVVAVTGLFYSYKNYKLLKLNTTDNINTAKWWKNLNWLLVIPILVLFTIPLRTLSSESFNLRTASSAFKISEQEKSKIKDKINFSIDTTQFNLYDWVKAKSLKDNSVFKDKMFSTTGFITPTKVNNQFLLSRFVVSCCVVDATPAGVLVEYEYSPKFQANDWLEVKGKFEIKLIDGVNQPVVVPTEIKKINQPDDIYLNRN